MCRYIICSCTPRTYHELAGSELLIMRRALIVAQSDSSRIKSETERLSNWNRPVSVIRGAAQKDRGSGEENVYKEPKIY